MKTNPVPDGYHTVTPYLFFKGAAQAIEFFKQAFGAAEIMRIPGPGGKIMHAEIQLGDSRVMVADEFPEIGAISPKTLGGASSSLMIYVENVDDIFKQAIDAGATVQRDVQDQFYGDRSGSLIDPFGHHWTIATHVEDVPEDELQRRLEAMQKSQE